MANPKKKVRRGRIEGLQADMFEFNFDLLEGHKPKKRKRKNIFDFPF